MNGKAYWKQQLPLLFLHFLCMIVLTLFLRVSGNSFDSIALILTVWLVVLAGYLWKSYRDRKAILDELLRIAEQLDERYLIAEVIDKPERADDQVYYQILKMAGKSMLEQIGVVKRERTEYKDHIEQWVHEIKTPITAMTTPPTSTIMAATTSQNNFTPMLTNPQ